MVHSELNIEKLKMVGKKLNRFRSVFEFDSPNFKPNSNLSKNTKLIGSNEENDVVRFGIFFVPFSSLDGTYQ